jgi:hypothetical protein
MRLINKKIPINNNLLENYEPESFNDFLGWIFFPSYLIYCGIGEFRKLYGEKIIIDMLRISVNYDNPLACFILRKYLLKLAEIDNEVNVTCRKELNDLYNRCLQVADDTYGDFVNYTGPTKILIDHEIEQAKIGERLLTKKEYQFDIANQFEEYPWLILLYNDSINRISFYYYYFSISGDIKILPQMLYDMYESDTYTVEYKELMIWLTVFMNKFNCYEAHHALARAYMKMEIKDYDKIMEHLSEATKISDMFGPIGYENMISVCEAHICEIKRDKNKKKKINELNSMIKKFRQTAKDFYGAYLTSIGETKEAVDKLIC